MNNQYIKRYFSKVSLYVMAILLFAAVHNSSAQVVVEQYLNLGAGNNNASFSFDTVSANDSVLLVAIGSEVHNFTSVTFDGVTQTTPVVFNDVGARESLVFAFDLGNETATSGQSIDIVANNTLGGASAYAVSVLQVSNADFSSIAGASSAGGDITVPALTAGALILDVVGSNDVGNDSLQPSGLSRTTLLAQQNVNSADHRSSLIENTTGGGVIGWTGESGGSNSGIWIEPPPPDITPPLWSTTYPKVDTATTDGFTVRAQIDEDGTAYYVVLADGASAPSPAQVKAGNDSNNAAALQAGSIVLTTDTENTAVITGLSLGTAYDVWLVAEDEVPNLQTTASSVDIITSSDATPPDWSATYPKTDTSTMDGFTVRAQINEDGTAYYVVLANGTSAPSPAQVKAGNDSNDAAALQAGSIVLTTDTENTAVVSGLSASTDYDVWFVAEDDLANLQAAASSVDITTAADTLAPEWSASYPQVDTPTMDGFTVRAQINEDGTAHYVVLANGASAPSPAQVKAGNDSNDAAALRAGSIVLTTDTENTAVVSGLSASTDYDVWFVAEDIVPNLQTTAIKVDSTTAIDPANGVSLVYSNVWDNITVNSAVSGQTDTFTGIDIDDSANLLVLVVPGESADVTGATFGGVPMILAKAYNQSYTRVELYILNNPNTASSQNLMITANGDNLHSGGYSPQLFAFSRVVSIGDTPAVGNDSAGTYSIDFGTAIAGSYLIMAGSVNGNTISFNSPAFDLFTHTGSAQGGWVAKTGREFIGVDSEAKTVGVTANARVAAIGLELIAVPEATIFRFR